MNGWMDGWMKFLLFSPLFASSESSDKSLICILPCNFSLTLEYALTCFIDKLLISDCHVFDVRTNVLS